MSVRALAPVLVLSTLLLAGCGAIVPMTPAKEANDAACATVTVRLPSTVADQGKRNVSHGCINLSPANAKWFYDNFGSGDPIVIKNSVGLYTNPDGADDWQWTLY